MSVALEDDLRRRWFRETILPLEGKLRAVAMRLTRSNSEDAEDLVHEALAKLLNHAGWRGVANPQAYALSVLRNQALQEGRRQRIVSIQAAERAMLEEFADDQPGPDRIAQGRSEMQVLMQAIDNLPSQCRRVFVLRKIYGLSYAEIADQMTLSVSTLEKHLIKGLRACSEALGRERLRSGSREKTEASGNGEARRA